MNGQAKEPAESKLMRVGMSGRLEHLPVGGRGARHLLRDGREVLDAATTPAALGHGDARLLEAMCAAGRSAPVIDESWETPERSAAVADLLEIAFGEDQEWVGAVRFAVTGSEVNDMALSLAQALTGRQALVTRERAYHGLVGLAREVTVQPHWHGGLSSRAGGVAPVPRPTEVRRLPFCWSEFGGGLDVTAEQVRATLGDAGSMLDDAAAVIVDYSQGGGYSTPSYQDEVATLAAARGTIWIADEVVTGFGKSGRWFNFQRCERRPDMVTMGKAFGGGLVPAAALVISKSVLERIGDASWRNYSALRSSPMTVAAISEFLRILRDDGLVERAERLHAVAEKGMRELAADHPSVRRIDGRSLHWTIELQSGEDWREWRADTASTPVAGKVAEATLAAGAVIATSGERDSLLITLPLIVTDEDLELLFSALDAGLAVADAELGVAA
jgi:4-aminobutyrate aminotransferase-like enzyme